MQRTEPRQIRTGGDPRQFPDFVALRHEMSKQNHPARPDIHWNNVERWSLSLFEQNGIELQTGAWYTLARSHLARSLGMNEGLSIIAVMLAHQWTQFWPQHVHTRIDMLSRLFKQLQKIFRTFDFDHNDQPSLKQLESTLLNFSDILKRQELWQASGISVLLKQVQDSLAYLDNSLKPDVIPLNPEISSAYGLLPLDQSAAFTPHLQYVILPESSTQPKRRVKQIDVFMKGMLTALLLGGVAIGGGYYLNQPSPVELVLEQSLQSFPHLPDAAAISQRVPSKEKEEKIMQWVKSASTRLDELAQLSPDWNIHYGDTLVSQMSTLWPERQDVHQLGIQWHQQLIQNGMDDKQLMAWHDGMTLLQQLADKLNKLDGQKGKYMTVSELKSQVFAITQSFNRSIPVEEQLRQMLEKKKSNMIPQALKMETEQHIKQLIIRYSELNHSDILASEQ